MRGGDVYGTEQSFPVYKRTSWALSLIPLHNYPGARQWVLPSLARRRRRGCSTESPRHRRPAQQVATRATDIQAWGGGRGRDRPRCSRSPPAAPIPASSGGQEAKDARTQQMQVQKDARVEKASRERLCSFTGSSLCTLGLLPRRKGLPEGHRSERRPPGTRGARGSAEGDSRRRAGTGAAPASTWRSKAPPCVWLTVTVPKSKASN